MGEETGGRYYFVKFGEDDWYLVPADKMQLCNKLLDDGVDSDWEEFHKEFKTNKVHGDISSFSFSCPKQEWF